MTVLYTNIMLPPKPPLPKKGGNNNKSKNRKQHLVNCKLILWNFYITYARNMHLSQVGCKKICLSVLLINHVKPQDKGLTVRTPLQTAVNYIFSKIINSNHKHDGFRSQPMRTTALLPRPLTDELPTLLGTESAPPTTNLEHATVFKPPLQFLSERNSADHERKTHGQRGLGSDGCSPQRQRGGRDDQGIPQGIKAQRKGGPRSTQEPGFSVGHGVALGACGRHIPTA